jgi:arylsulfatase A-like enzyme
MPGAAAGAECGEPVITMDILPTVLGALQLAAPTDLPIDGVSLLPLLDDPRAKLDREAIYWHYPHYHSMGARPYSAIRMGDWKLIEHHGGRRPVELYDLANDLHEDRNLATIEVERTEQLLEHLNGWRQSVGAQMAEPNPGFDPGQPTGIQFGIRFRDQAPIRGEVEP